MVGTFKVITLASAIEEKKVNLFEDQFYDAGSIKVDGAKIKCWKYGGHGAETFLDVVKNSCNPGFVVLGQRLGKENLMKYIKEFGFGEKTGIGLSGEEDGILFNVDKMGPVETATTAFGQGVSVTPIQQVMGISAAVNGGYLYTPYIVSSIKTNETNETILTNTPKLKRQVISEETSSLVRFALESVVAEGTGRNAFLNGYRIGGKTGTAQKVKDGKYMDGNYILSFIGFLPANDPEITIYVSIDNPKGVTQYGGTVSAPIAKSVLSEVVNILNIPKSTEGIERKYELWDTIYVKVDDVVGMNKVDARKVLSKNFKIEYSGSGETVIEQSPRSDEYIKKGDTVRIMLN